jgi:hypothetical protein
MDKTISLLRFIESEKNGFLLDIPLFDEERKPRHNYSFPFHVIDNGQNFSIVVKGGLKTTSSETFKPLFLLIQRDHYPILPDDLNPVTNPDLDKIWLETIQFYSTDNTAFHIPYDAGNGGEIAQFSPLFFCQKQSKFFHPPCPECGEPLDLCKDDRILKTAGLFPYNASLKRYLFCPSCYQAGRNPIFYQFSRFPEDRVFIRDRFDLIKDFSKLRSIASGNFPCLDCPGHSGCYITGEKAASFIHFFSFYPFHMLFFDVAPIKATDFIPFISGRSFDGFPSLKKKTPRTFGQIPDHQGEDLFFFNGGDQFFLEVLYLKLSFLKNIACSVNQRFENNPTSLIRLSAHSIWITPAPQGTLLPFFWNFKVTIIDLISNSPETPLDFTLTGNRNLNFMACLWFYTFLANEHQGPNEVYKEIKRLSVNKSPEDYFSDYDRLIENFPALALENIFWTPRGVSLPEKWRQFWLRSLLTGVVFIKEANTKGLKNGLDQLTDQIGDLQQEIKNQLFSTRSVAPTQGHEKTVPFPEEKIEPETKSLIENHTITQILKQLKTKWMDNRLSQENSLEPIEDDVLETIVLSSPEENQPNVQFNEKTMVLPRPETEPETEPGEGNDFDDMEKTVILSGAKAEPEQANDFDTMEETIIMSPDAPPKPPADFFGKDDDLEKTMIIPPKTKR